MITLLENEKFLVYHEWEEATLVNKETNEKIDMGSHYGDPMCAIMPSGMSWCIVGGEGLSIWKKSSNNVTRIINDEINDIVRIKLVSENEVLLLVDPWSLNASIWRFNVKN